MRENPIKWVIFSIHTGVLFFFTRAVVVPKFIRDDTVTRHLEEHSSITKVVLWVKSTHQIVQVRFFSQDRTHVRLILLRVIFLPYDVVGGDHVALEEGYSLSLPTHEASLVQESRHAIHFDQVLDILFLLEAFLGNKELSMTV